MVSILYSVVFHFFSFHCLLRLAVPLVMRASRNVREGSFPGAESGNGEGGDDEVGLEGS
ncbi:hypothetical protein I79_001433 [Cricetulus griseus]|uniref:Uncharacterized protein n=1 Tax=Cricetulus griseus TaxID=10029 RepID=G3GUR2_CRIGR|nr:hypothetical protein I79_001433 [Cricetulus griseus]